MKILVTGAQGFVGKNLCAELKNQKLGEVLEYDLNTDPSLLDKYAAECDFVFHLAGVNRPEDPAEFMKGNFGFTTALLNALSRCGRSAPIMLASSAQAALDNPYGESKRAGEELLRAYGLKTGTKIFLYRFPNLFGKWCRPNYNSVVATFCHNVACGLPIHVDEPQKEICFAYIDDVVAELLNAFWGREHRAQDFCTVPVTYMVSLGRLAELLLSFRESRKTLLVPNLADPFVKKLYATYVSYLPADSFSYDLCMHSDERGSFTEFLRTPERGQVSVNVAKPGVVKGGHWHHTKNEKFLVVSGHALIRLRKIGSSQVLEYRVSNADLQFVDIPCGYTHSIQNIGDDDLVTVMWASELFDPKHPDTYFEMV